MIVTQILKSKAVAGVLTLGSDATIAQAVAIMARERVGTVVISDDEGVTAAGILSERDVVRGLGTTGAACLDKTVDTLMTRKLVTCTGADTSDAVLSTMSEGRFRHMPVIEDGRLVGLVSIGDVVKARLSQLAMERDALTGMVMGY